MKPAYIDKGWESFLGLCTKIHDPDHFNQFLSLFLTHEERETLASRYLIVKELLAGELTQRDMADTFKMSIAQITRGSNALKIIDPDFKTYLQKLMKDQ